MKRATCADCGHRVPLRDSIDGRVLFYEHDRRGVWSFRKRLADLCPGSNQPKRRLRAKDRRRFGF